MTTQQSYEKAAEETADKTAQTLRTAQDKAQDALRATQDKAQEAIRVTQDKAQEAIRSGTQYVRENPVPAILGAFLLGGALGAILASCNRREAEPPHGAREWLESTLQEISNRLPRAKKQACGIQDSIVDQAQEIGRKFRFW